LRPLIDAGSSGQRNASDEECSSISSVNGSSFDGRAEAVVVRGCGQAEVRVLLTASGDAVLALQRLVRHAIAGVAPQRGVQLHLRLARRHRGCSFTRHIQLDTATPMVTSEFANILPRGLLARAIRSVNGGITRPDLEPIATAATPPTAETAPLPPAQHHKNINSSAASRLHPTE